MYLYNLYGYVATVTFAGGNALSIIIIYAC